MQRRGPQRGGGRGNSRQGQGPRAKVYEPHWTEEDIQRGLEGVRLVKGTIKVHERVFTEAYVSQPVVAIGEREHPTMMVGKIKEINDSKHALFLPIDRRLNRMLFPSSDSNCPRDFSARPKAYENTLFVGCITSWEDTSKMPMGNLIARQETADEDSSSFGEKVLACFPQDSPWAVPETEIASRTDLRSSCIFTIDPSTARKLDDAVSCEELGNGEYKVGVHIADVTYFVKEGTELDRVAAQRANNVYRFLESVPMLPRSLCEEMCSLKPNEDRLAFSVEWIINQEGEILSDARYRRTVIRSCAKLSYDDAQGFIKQPDRKWESLELPAIRKPFTSTDVVKKVLVLNKIAVALRKKRLDNGALLLNWPETVFILDEETKLPTRTFSYQMEESHRLIEEFMHLANKTVAKRIKDSFPHRAILKRQDAPNDEALEALEKQFEELGLEINTATTVTLQKSLRKYDDGKDKYSKARFQYLVDQVAIQMRGSSYICTGTRSDEATLPDDATYHHYAMNIPLYTSFTSPMHHYVDIIIHRLLAASIDGSTPLMSVQEIEKNVSHCNDKSITAKTDSEKSKELYLFLYLKRVGRMEASGIVKNVWDKSFEVLIPSLRGITRFIILLKDLPLQDLSFERKDEGPQLTLVWKADENCNHATKHIISVLTMVECVLSTDEEPLPFKWSCVIQRPKEGVKFVQDKKKA